MVAALPKLAKDMCHFSACDRWAKNTAQNLATDSQISKRLSDFTIVNSWAHPMRLLMINSAFESAVKKYLHFKC